MANRSAGPRRLEQLTAADLAPLEALFHPRYPDRLREMATVLYMALLDNGHKQGAAQLALAQTEALSINLGGGQFYMHKGTNYRKSKQHADRDRQIRAEFRGYNLPLLAHKYNLSEMRIRQILDDTEDQAASRMARRERESIAERSQAGLFPSADSPSS